jgi:hypothetical protein
LYRDEAYLRHLEKRAAT